MAGRWIFAAATFLGAFLLFLIQPLIGKYILPWFGGTPAVWTTCMLFFQCFLLGGYAYAHWSISHLTPRRQAWLHMGLLLAALCFLPIVPGNQWKPLDGSGPAARILLLLAAAIGLPYLVLSATGPLLQAWFARAFPKVSPYRLYALSNAGSLLALASFPFLWEPHFSRASQAAWWGGGLFGFACLAAGCAWMAGRGFGRAGVNEAAQGRPALPKDAHGPDSPVRGVWLWFAFPACATALLLAVTNKLCCDVAVVPFLWVLPLGLYLLTFIISFDSPRWYWRPLWMAALVLTLAAALWISLGTSISPPTHPWAKPARWLHEAAVNLTLWKTIALHLGILFVCCLVCHGEVYRLRPPAHRLTGFYLAIAAGGAGGGLFVAVLAPMLFQDYYEWHAALFALAVLAAAALLSDPQSKLYRGRPIWAAVLVSLGCLGFGVGLQQDVALEARGVREIRRNFYGVLRVEEYQSDQPRAHKLSLQHGTTTHGVQFQDAVLRRRPTAYYTRTSGVGLTMEHFPRMENRRVGVVGLGTGTMAAWGHKGDHFRFYEINRTVEELARSRFTYLADSPARIEVLPGDARLVMEREPACHYDILVLDAFSSDAIPVHLLTKEAFEIYQRHLQPDGVLVVHISNKYLNLEPVVLRAARHFQWGVAVIHDPDAPTVAPGEEDEGASNDFYSSDWVLLSRNQAFLSLHPVMKAAESAPPVPTIPLWTDDRCDLFRVLVLDDDHSLSKLRHWILGE